MNKKASVSRASWLVCSTLGLAFGADVALAQQAADVVVQADRPEIMVKTPVRGSVIKEISLAQPVSYADLNLTTPAGVAELKKRNRLVRHAYLSGVERSGTTVEVEPTGKDAAAG